MPQYAFLQQASETSQFADLAAFDSNAVANAMEGIAEAAAKPDAEVLREVLQDPAATTILDAIFGNSPFLTRIALRNPGFLGELLSFGPDQVADQILTNVRSLAIDLSETELMAQLRRAREHLALTVATADIAGVWDLTTVTRALTDFVDAALQAVTAHLLMRMHRAGFIELNNGDSQNHRAIAEGSGIFILGMGKLGSFELNYSSDIDLIILYDDEVVPCRGKKAPRELLIKFVQDLVRIIQSQTADGYVHRVDLRLRPDPASTPAAISTEFAELYYESRGRNWERAAMIKARTIAGDQDAGRAYLKMMEPFVWRRHFDFAAIDDIRGITRQLQSVNRHTGIKTRGHDIKIGPGGIREIEFYVQTQQLVTGGRNPALRAPATTAALRAMRDSGIGSAELTDDMLSAYDFLRTLEHRVQMVNDEQTHIIPADDEGFARIATFMGFPSTDTFEATLRETLERVHEHYNAQFPEISDTPDEIHHLLHEDEPTETALAYFADKGFSAPDRALLILKEWHQRSYRVLQNDRTHELLSGLMEDIVTTFGGSLDPDLGLHRFDQFIRNLPAGVQLFSLFHANPWLLELLSDIFGTAPAIAEKLSRHSEMFDALLGAEFYEPVPARQELEVQLRDRFSACESYEDILDAARSWMNDLRLQIGVQQLGNVIGAPEAAHSLSSGTEALVATLLPAVEAEFAQKFGGVSGQGMAVIGMGNFGSRELTMTSDLDLIFVYDGQDQTAQSDGRTSLAVPQYFSRLSQRFINALTAMTRQGLLFEVDMRLRPSGNQGPVATSLESFRKYHEDSSWTWEQMALTRARVIAGDPSLSAKISSVIHQTLTRERQPEALAQDVDDMRKRIDSEYATDNVWALKYVRGGLIDLEFLAQLFVLKLASEQPEFTTVPIADLFTMLGEQGVLPLESALALAAAYNFQRSMQSQIRLCLGTWDPTKEGPSGMHRILGRLNDGKSYTELESELSDHQTKVRKVYADVMADFQ